MSVRKDTVQLEVIINGQKAGENMKQLRGTIRDLNRELDTLEFGTDAYNKKAAEIALATAKMNQHKKAIREASLEYENAGKRVNPFTDALKKGALAAIGFFSVQRVIQWGKEFLHFITAGTIALEDMRDKSQRTFGDAIDIVEDFAKANAQSLGVTEEKYISLASQIGAMLIPMGFAREEAAKMSSEALNLSASLAEWSNGTLTVEQTQEILGKAILGQTKGLKQLGISISEADIKTRLAVDGNNKLTGAALKQAKAQATLALITEQSADAQAEFAASSGDAGRAASRIGLAYEQIKENFLKSILPAIKAVTNAVANSIAPFKQQSDIVKETQIQFNAEIAVLKSGVLTKQATLKLVDSMAVKYKELGVTTEDLTSGQARLEETLIKVNAQFDKQIRTLNLTEQYRALDKQLLELEQSEGDLAVAAELANKQLKDFQDQLGSAFTQQVSADDYNAAFNLIQSSADNATIALNNNQKAQADLIAQREKLLKFGSDQGIDFEAGNKRAAEAEAARLLAEQKRLAEEAAEQARIAREKRLKDELDQIEKFYEKEKLLKLQSIEFLRDNDEEYNAERERITIQAEIDTAKAKAVLYKNGSVEYLKFIQEALDKEAALREKNETLAINKRIEQINIEFELRRKAIIAEYEDQEELSYQLSIADLNRQQQLAKSKLETLKQGDADYEALQNEIALRQIDIDRKQADESLRITTENIELQRELTLAGVDQLKLDEEDLQKYRQRINLEYDKKILEARLKTFDPDSVDGVKTKNAISEIDRQLAQQGSGFLVDDKVANSGGSSTPADKEKKRDKLQEAADAAIGVASNTASTLLDIERTRIDQQLQSELNSIQTLADAKRRAAGDDAVELAKIDAQARAAREKAEKKAAQDRKKLARKEAVIQGALAVVEALPNAFAAIAAGIATALQLAVIDSQSFFYGGPTGSKGIYRDKSGKNVAGLVHTNEYVVPEHITQDPRHQPVISYLENVRRAKGGFADGGFTNVSTRPASYVQTVTSTSTSNEMAEIRDTLRSIERLVGAWPREVKARVVYTELEKVGEDLNYIRSQATA